MLKRNDGYKQHNRFYTNPTFPLLNFLRRLPLSSTFVRIYSSSSSSSGTYHMMLACVIS